MERAGNPDAGKVHVDRIVLRKDKMEDAADAVRVRAAAAVADKAGARVAVVAAGAGKIVKAARR